MSDGAVLSFFTSGPDGEPVVLHGEHPVTVTKEERHQAALARHLSSDGRSRQMAVELGFCRIAEGKYRGGRAIEVRIGGERVGELTARMSERYAPLVEAVLAAGRRPVCEAEVTVGSRGAQVELRLPAPDTLPTLLPPPPQIAPTAWTTTSSTGPDERWLPAPPTTASPMARPTQRSGPLPRGKVGMATRHIDSGATAGSHRQPMGDPSARPPAPRKNRKRKAVLWGVGAFLGLGFLGSLGDDEPAPPAAASSVAATTSARSTPTPTPTPTPAVTTTTTTTTTTTAGVAAGAGAGAGVAVDLPDRERTTSRRTSTTTPPPARTREQPASVYYKNCAAVRAANAAPIRRGDPGYASHLDQDGDGVGCERS